MNPSIILFLMGLSPSMQNNSQTIDCWLSMTNEEQQAIVQQFESDYKVDTQNLTSDDLMKIKRAVNLRAWDLQDYK